MNTPKATEAAVAAVQQALGCIRGAWPSDASPAWCDTHWEEGDDTGSQWTERGCPVAVAAANAAAPHIAAQTLKDAANEAAAALVNEVGSGNTTTYSVRRWLRDCADRIEAGQ